MTNKPRIFSLKCKIDLKIEKQEFIHFRKRGLLKNHLDVHFFWMPRIVYVCMRVYAYVYAYIVLILLNMYTIY